MVDNDVKLKEMYITMCSFLEYGHFLEYLNDNDMEYKYVDFDKLYAIFIGLFFTTIIDEYIEITEKDNIKSAKVLLNPNFVEKLALIISEKKDDRYYLPGGLSYGSSDALIDKVRNKLAHGDYIVKDGNICFTEKNIEAKISINKLINFINTFAMSYKKNKLYGVGNCIIINKINKDDTDIYCKKELNEETLNEYLSQITVCSVKDKPREKRDQKYVDLYDEVNRCILELMINYPKIGSIEVLKKVKESYDLDSVGMELKINFEKLINKEYFVNIIDYYHKKWEVLDINKESYINMSIDKVVSRYENKNVINQHCLDGIGLNLNLINLKKTFPKMEINDILILLCRAHKSKNVIEEILKFIPKEEINNNMILMCKNPNSEYIAKKILKLLFNDYEDALVSIYIGGFNALYQYGLENGYRLLGDYTIAKLANGNYLDFSQLEIDNLHCDDSKIEYKFDSYIANLEKYNSDSNERKYFDAARRAMELKQKYLENVPTEKQDVKKIAMFEKKIKEALNHLNEYWRQSVNSEYFLENLDKDLFIKNVDTITHIRNAIAHGRVYIDAYDNREALEKDITFVDIGNDGNIVYKKTIPIKEFVQIFKMKNFYILEDFMLYNIKDNSGLRLDYSDKLNERIDAQKVYKKSL